MSVVVFFACLVAFDFFTDIMAFHGTAALELRSGVQCILDHELSEVKVKTEPGSSSDGACGAIQQSQAQHEAWVKIEASRPDNWEETVRSDRNLQMQERLMALYADDAAPLDSTGGSRHFSKLRTQTGEKLLECYAKCYRFAKSLEKGPRDNRLKRLGEALEQSHELREAVLNGVLPAPSVEARPVAERKAREHQSRQQKKRNAEEEERKRKRDEFEEEKKAFEEEKSRWEQAQARREEELERRERQILKDESKMQLKVDNMHIEVQQLQNEKRALERFLVAQKRL